MGSRPHMQSKIQMYLDAGFDRYDIMVAGDEHVCAHCRALAEAGPYLLTDPVFPDESICPDCRCTIVAHV